MKSRFVSKFRLAIAVALTAASLIVFVVVAIENTRLFAWWKDHGGEGSWTEHVISGLLLFLPSLAAVTLLVFRRRPSIAATLAVLGLALAGMSWVGMRT